MSSNDEDRWNAFRSHKRITIEAPSLTSWMITAIQSTKLLMFVCASVFLTIGSCISKLVVILLATNLHDGPLPQSSDQFASTCTNGVHRTKKALAGMMIALFLIECLPEVISLFKSVCRIHRGEKAGRSKCLVIFLEGARSTGLSLLVFHVFPELDSARCVILMSALPLVALFQTLLSKLLASIRPASSFMKRIGQLFATVPPFLCTLILLSSIYLWVVLDVPFRATVALPLGIILSSFGFWESWIGPQHEGTLFHSLYEIKYGLWKLNCSTRIFKGVIRISTVLIVLASSAHGFIKTDLFIKCLTSFGWNHASTRLIVLALLVCLLNCLLRLCIRLLAAMDMKQVSLLHPIFVTPPLSYFLIRYICSNGNCWLSEVLAPVGIQLTCNAWTVKPFDDSYFTVVWLIVGTYQAWLYVSKRRFDSDDEIIDSISPVTNGFCIEQSLVLFQHSMSKMEDAYDISLNDLADEYLVRNDEVDRTLTVYICGTMWHETTVEMTQMVRSILKLDEEHIRRLNNLKKEKLKFKLEAHIYFDDAWVDVDDGDSTKRIPNEFFETFFKLLNQMTGVVDDAHTGTRVILTTPYGGRVVIRLPAGTLLFVHLKDKKLIRHKKRWSQVMYLYYLLGHRIMDSAMSIEDRQQMADSTFILAIDGDSKFEPDALLRLLSLMQQKPDIGCACGRIHPIGSGVMVWYQKFEYAIAHWFQKAAEHVFGCVLCAPGCFSLFRASALMDDNIMHKHFVQYDQGEDRWLSTLMLKQGYRIEYVAASDAETYAPEGFDEFFNQRRRWTPSSIANTIDLLSDYKRVSTNNNSISMAYIAYQFFVIAFSMLGPAIIFSMVVFAQTAAFGVDSATMMMLNGVPILLFIFLCFATESNVQLFYAKILSIVYAYVMLAVLIATTSQIVLETIVSPTSMFVVAMVAIFFIAACIHPAEFTNVIYGTVFFLMIPSTYIFLTLYSLINLNVINWGTREAVAKATGKVETKSGFERWLRRIGEGPLAALFPSLRVKGNENVEALERKIERLEQSISSIQKLELAEEALAKVAKVCGGPANLNDSVISSHVSEVQREQDDDVPSEATNKEAWMDTGYLQICERGRLKTSEERFWNNLISAYLKPIHSSAANQREIAEGLASLRNNIAFTVIIINSLLVLVIYLIQKHKNVLSIKWTPYDGFTWTKMNEMNGQFEETEDPLKIDPLGMAIIVFLIGILIVQSIGMFLHRLNTMIGAFQEVKHVQDMAMSQRKNKSEDEKILSAARQLLDASFYIKAHGTDGYTRYNEEINKDANVLYKLQRARLAERLKRGGALL